MAQERISVLNSFGKTIYSSGKGGIMISFVKVLWSQQPCRDVQNAKCG